MIQTYQPPVMEVGHDTLPELQRIFTFLNSHSNKLYQEGYFLKFHDTDSRGRPAPDRVWQECFAQLVGTVLSLWDASELDKAEKDANVLPSFINLTDAAITMMPSMQLGDSQKLENILSVSTAASNKYLFHFNSFNSLTQWTAGIRLAMYEHTTLQEAYTGSLIAGKGKTLNNIRTILERTRVKHEDWARVRFGAGTPWRRCWCVITPPDEKEYTKLQKTIKKQNMYDRSPVILKGDVKFYDTKKFTKKTRPIATVTEAYSAFAIYPQSKPLIDQSTLVKIEGRITIHSQPESVTEGFVFVMPEVHPAVSGFEIMLRFLLPVFDTFALYGRPNKLVSDVLDTRGLMFAMPTNRRYGYLEMWDVVSLIHTEGSQTWSGRQWRKQLKDLTSKRMTAGPSRDRSRASSRRNTVSRTSLPPSRNGTLRFDESASIRSQPSTRRTSPTRAGEADGPRRVESAPPATSGLPRHQRSVSEAHGYRQYQSDNPSRLAYGIGANDQYNIPPPPPEHRVLNGENLASPQREAYDTASEGDDRGTPEPHFLPDLQASASAARPRGPVASPPAFAHAPGQKPPTQPFQPPELLKANVQMDSATLHQLADASHTPLPVTLAAAGAAAAWRGQDTFKNDGRRSGEYERRMEERSQWGSYMDANSRGLPADQSAYHPGIVPRSGQTGNRLPTIPASPYVEQPEFSPGPNASFSPAGPPVPEHAEIPQSQRYTDQHGELGPTLDGSGQAHRKPLPGRSSTPSREEHDNLPSPASSSLGSLRKNVIDPETLDNLDYIDPSLLDPPLLRALSKSSSNYDDDTASSSTPDYASTNSAESRIKKLPVRREDRPRSGVLRRVGNPDYGTQQKKEEISTDILDINFGPTYNLTREGRPGTSGTMTQVIHDRASRSREGLGEVSSDRKRDSQISGGASPNSPDSARGTDGRNVAWQPGMGVTVGAQSSRPKLDPEEWVQQRATMAAQPRTSPIPAHGRSKSSNTSPVSRQVSGDWSQLQAQHQRTPTLDSPGRPPSRPLSRPQSRGAGPILGTNKPTTLSAREQENIARATGTPLIDLTKNAKDTQRPSPAGLVGYVEQRNEQRALAKQNVASAAVQAEIERRKMEAQRQQMQMQMQQMSSAQSSYPSPAVTGMPQNFSQPLTYPSPSQGFQQQGYFPPQGWDVQSPQQLVGQYGASGYVQQSPIQQHTPPQPYGASWDQAQAAARLAQQQGQSRR